MPTDSMSPQIPMARQGASDERKMFFFIERAARRGNRDAQYALGRMYEHGNGVARDPVEAFAWYRRAAGAGNAQARAALEQLKPELSAEGIAAAERRARNR